jgi:hypothetical protein
MEGRGLPTTPGTDDQNKQHSVLARDKMSFAVFEKTVIEWSNGESSSGSRAPLHKMIIVMNDHG